MSSLRVSEVSSSCTRAPADRCWRTVVSSSSSLEGKKSDGWSKGVLGEDLGWGGFHQLWLFEAEMVVVHECTSPVREARSFVTLGPG